MTDRGGNVLTWKECVEKLEEWRVSSSFMTRTSSSDVQRRSGGAVSVCMQTMVGAVHVWGQRDSGKVCSSRERWVPAGAGITSEIHSEPFLLAVLMDRLADELRQESQQLCLLRTLWSVVRAGSRWVEESLQRWRYALKRRVCVKKLETRQWRWRSGGGDGGSV